MEVQSCRLFMATRYIGNGACPPSSRQATLLTPDQRLKEKGLLACLNLTGGVDSSPLSWNHPPFRARIFHLGGREWSEGWVAVLLCLTTWARCRPRARTWPGWCVVTLRPQSPRLGRGHFGSPLPVAWHKAGLWFQKIDVKHGNLSSNLGWAGLKFWIMLDGSGKIDDDFTKFNVS